jgi:hypothetical protein
LIRSANPKYFFGKIFINIDPMNKRKKVHKEIIPRYFKLSVLKKPIANKINEIIVHNTTAIVTIMCILSWKLPANPDSDNGKNVYPKNEKIVITQRNNVPKVTNGLIACLKVMKKYTENITENNPYKKVNIIAIFFDGELEAVKSLTACAIEL